MSFWLVQKSYLDFRKRRETCINSEQFNTGTTGRHISRLLAPRKSKFLSESMKRFHENAAKFSGLSACSRSTLHILIL